MSLDYNSKVEAIETGQNEAFIFLNIIFNEKVEKFDIAINTVKSKDNDEFLLRYDNGPKLVVNPGYNWIKGRYASIPSDYDDYEELIQLINSENTSKDGIYKASEFVNLSELRIGSLKDNLNHIEVNGNNVTIRLTYGLLGISDPTSNRVLYDERVFIPSVRDSINTTISDELEFKMIIDEYIIPFDLMMNTWSLPEYDTRLKEGLMN